MRHRLSQRFAADPGPRVFGLAIAVVIALQFALVLRHDYFVDEWQALQIAVQSPDLAALLANLRYEGHPPLWYLLLRGLAVLVGPGHALAAASLLCAGATIAIVGLCSPWPRWMRLAVLVSEPILFEFGTISRSYALGAALTFAVLALWHRRRAVWAVLALLPLVDFLCGVMALALIALRWSERGRASLWPAGGALFAASALLAAWTVIPAADFVSVYPPTAALESVARWTREMATVMLPVQWRGGPLWDTPWVTPVTPLLGIGFLAMAYLQTAGRRVERAVAAGFPLFLLAFMVGVHTLAIRHLMLAAVVFLAVLWRQGAAGVPLRRLTKAWLAAIAACGLATAGFALSRPFDTATQAVHAIRKLGLARETWLSFPAQHAQGVAALSGIGFEALGPGCRGSFVRWNFPHDITTPTQLRDRLVAEGRRGGRFYLVSEHQPAPGGPVTLLAAIPPGLDGKAYYLLRVDGTQPGRRAAAAPCVPGVPGVRPLPPLLPK